MKTKKIMHRANQSWLFEKINMTDKPLTKLKKKKERRPK